ncbi:MAG TPA: PQQ-binding-like beta-propeller repeat protein, partial [Pseudomonadaceae bacterium]|nr:PQQ-binding-like beta-propeller repeat protein [Pseudomonadaceae bacterium]
DARLLALDQRTGEVVWEVEVEDAGKGYSITGGTRYYDGRVFLGLAGGEYQTRGRVMAFDADSGETVWTFYTIPGPGEVGHETWPDYNDSWMYGGAPVWQTPAIDPELGMIYFSTGNAQPDLNGSLREGDNLFTVSIVALDVNTGEYRWHFQQTRHDIWDYDSSSPVVLFDVEQDGVPRKGLSQISKSGYLFLLDRITGAPLTPIVDTPVPQVPEQFTAATQPIPQGDTMINHCLEEAPEGWELVNNGCTYTPFGREPVLYTPLAGSNWMPTSYDPQTGTLYVCATESVGGAYMGDWTEEEIGQFDGSAEMGGGFSMPQGIPRRAYQVAVDVTNHMRKWRTEVSTCTAPSSVTAGGLLLTGRADMFTAIDSSNGDVLAEFLLDAGLYTNPVIVDHQGEQYVLLFAGGSAFGPGPKGDSLYLLSLNGSAALPTERADDSVQLSTVMPVTESDLAGGETIYNTVCTTCHGADGQGGHADGGAIPRDITIEGIYATAVTGVDEKMPSFANIYTPEQLKNVSAYILERVLQ